MTSPFEDFAPQPDWSQAACANTGMGGDAFFPDHKGEQYTFARRVCDACPLSVREACLAWAIANDEEGFWAGTTQKQRRLYRQQQKAAA